YSYEYYCLDNRSSFQPEDGYSDFSYWLIRCCHCYRATDKWFDRHRPTGNNSPIAQHSSHDTPQHPNLFSLFILGKHNREKFNDEFNKKLRNEKPCTLHL